MEKNLQNIYICSYKEYMLRNKQILLFVELVCFSFVFFFNKYLQKISKMKLKL